MSASSRETSKAAGEIVASAEQLRGTAEELARLVSEFRLTAEASTSSGSGGGIAGPRLAAHTSWTKTFHRTASDAGSYRATIRVTDRAGTSDAAATARRRAR